MNGARSLSGYYVIDGGYAIGFIYNTGTIEVTQPRPFNRAADVSLPAEKIEAIGRLQEISSGYEFTRQYTDGRRIGVKLGSSMIKPLG